MAGANHANHEFVGENHPNPPNHHNQFDGQEASVTPEGSAAHAQVTPLDVPPPHQPPQPEDPLVVPQVPQGAPMEVVMAALVNTINRQGQILREQANNMRGQNELIREQNRRLRAVEESRAASRVSRSARRQRSPTPENNRSRSRSRSPRPAPRRNAERPVSPPRDIPRRQNHSPPRRNNHVSQPRNRRSPPRRNNRSPPRSGEAAARGGNARHSPRRESPSSGDERHRGPLSRRIMDIPLPRGLEKPPTLDKYDGTTDPDEHVQSVETALDYRNLRGSIKCKLFPLSLTRGASTWWRNLPPGSIDSWEELCRIFVAKSAQHTLPLFKLLRKETTFEWTEECEEALQHLKGALSEPPVLTRPVEGEKLYLYLAVASEAISAVLIRETEQGQKPAYFVSRALQGPELRYLQIEKIALAVIMAARKLRYYFLAHSIIIRTDQPVKQLLARPDMVGRMLKWSLELAEFDISFESRKALKAQVLTDFVAEMTTSTTSEKNKRTIFVDGSSNSQGSGAGIILESGDGVLIEVSLGLSFPTTNNQAEYEAFLAGLRLAEDIGAEEIKIFTDSQLVASQVSGEYQTKEERLLEYLNLIRTKLAKFKETEVKHVPREHNARADVLSKLASTRHKKAGNQSLIQETLTKPSIEKTAEIMHICAVDEQSWMSPRILNPIAQIVEEARVEFILQEIHEGINGQHISGRSLARKALRAGYYWPTMQNDAKDHVLKCDKCQRHGDMHLAPANELKTLISPWPFAWWGMDILGPFPTAARQVKYLIVAVDYFTKWIEAEPLAKISASNILRFFKRNVLARFGIPQVVFTNKKFQEFLATIGTTQHFTSVEHPQTNGQAEAANRVLLRGLRRRMGTSKGNWTEELHNVLWSYRTTPHSTTGETLFRLTYRTEAVIPVEIREPSSRIEYPPEEDTNDELLREELDLVEELRTGASLREATLKQKIAARHDKRVIKREFKVGSLVLRRNQKDSREGKLAANWEGPYRVRAKTENGAYHLEDLSNPTEETRLYNGGMPSTCPAERPARDGRFNAARRVLNKRIVLDSSLGASQTLEQFHKLLRNGAYDLRHQEATVIIRRALA
ncbi:hypothetical protein TSUD_285710 [Trifolium subterraneum]|uniref:Uncharacterized protein n=1 Tax=Trifolium subterraneum TaxID=3900 RepID=A0A2Z6P9J2_TRISU|nr:hypothetical protein TSUD_285710 [Trifolium subterraneum]